MLIYAVVNFRMDYCNTILAGAPWIVNDKLQRVLNTAAHVVTVLGSLMAALVRYCTFQTGPTSSLQWQFTSVWTTVYHRICRSTASRSPVLTHSGICVLQPSPTCRSAFLMAWNSLLDFIGDPTSSIDCFRHLLKSYLFARYKCIQHIKSS